jgi:trans-aconitate methyltransferase
LDWNIRIEQHEAMTQTWSPSDYQQHAGFVPVLGASILGQLAPQPGERVLDLGCGDGALTVQIAASGASVVGIDASPEMIAAARARGLDARVVDARALPFAREFDAVFSNAALHWIPQADDVLEGVARALRPGGRFVAEFGGHMNVASIAVAIRAVFARHGVPYVSPWYYPTPDEYAGRLQAHGFGVRSMRLFPRPTPLPTGMEAWLRTFGIAQRAGLDAEGASRIEAEIVELLRPSLCDTAGQWTADYVRLQVVAERAG